MRKFTLICPNIFFRRQIWGGFTDCVKSQGGCGKGILLIMACFSGIPYSAVLETREESQDRGI